MRSKVIRHPANEPIVMFRRWQLLACEGNICAAMLLNHFEYWHGVKLAHAEKARRANQVAEQHGDAPTQDQTLWQFHSLDDLERALLGAYRRNSIISAISLLEELGFIVTGSNPNPRYKFDRTKFFLFQTEAVQERADALTDAGKPSKKGLASSENKPPSFENQPPSFKNKPPSFENQPTIPEITCTEITTEITNGEGECVSQTPHTTHTPPSQPSSKIKNIKQVDRKSKAKAKESPPDLTYDQSAALAIFCAYFPTLAPAHHQGALAKFILDVGAEPYWAALFCGWIARRGRPFSFMKPTLLRDLWKEFEAATDDHEPARYFCRHPEYADRMEVVMGIYKAWEDRDFIAEPVAA